MPSCRRASGEITRSSAKRARKSTLVKCSAARHPVTRESTARRAAAQASAIHRHRGRAHRRPSIRSSRSSAELSAGEHLSRARAGRSCSGAHGGDAAGGAVDPRYARRSGGPPKHGFRRAAHAQAAYGGDRAGLVGGRGSGARRTRRPHRAVRRAPLRSPSAIPAHYAVLGIV